MYNQSYTILAHELYHAYQDDINKSYPHGDDFAQEREAVKFENYIRRVLGGGVSEQRLKYGGRQILRTDGVTSYLSII